MDVLTLAIAALGLVMAAASLSWQLATWQLSGARINVELLLGGATHGGLYTQPVKSWRGSPTGLAEFGPYEHRAFIRVRNVGRAPVDVEGVEIASTTGISFKATSVAAWEQSMPHRLQPGASETWSVSLSDVVGLLGGLRAIGHKELVRGVVHLGTGRSKSSAEGISLRQLEPYLPQG